MKFPRGKHLEWNRGQQLSRRIEEHRPWRGGVRHLGSHAGLNGAFTAVRAPLSKSPTSEKAVETFDPFKKVK